jgi:hypothetical protein
MRIRSSVRPQDIPFENGYVLVASNIQPYEEEIDGRVKSGYEYECTRYT